MIFGEERGGVDGFFLRYSGVRALGINFIVFPMLAWMWWIGGLGLLWPLTAILAAVAIYSLATAMLALDRRPLLVITNAGVVLPWLDNELITYADLDSFWFTQNVAERTVPRKYYWSLSLQCRPRRDLARPLWAMLRDIRTNTLLEGDVRFDCRYFSTSVVEIAEQLKRRHPGGWIDADRPGELDAILPRGS